MSEFIAEQQHTPIERASEETHKYLDNLFENYKNEEIRCLFRVEPRKNPTGKGAWWTPDIVESCEMYYANNTSSKAYAFLISEENLSKWVQDCTIKFRGGLYLYFYTNFREHKEHNDNIMPYYIIEDSDLIKSVLLPKELISQTYLKARNEFPPDIKISNGLKRFSMMQRGEQEAIRAIRNWSFFIR